MFPPQLSTPPTPFADRETLEKELKALEQDLGDLRSLTNPSWLDHDANASYADSTTTGERYSSACMYIMFDVCERQRVREGGRGRERKEKKVRQVI